MAQTPTVKGSSALQENRWDLQITADGTVLSVVKEGMFDAVLAARPKRFEEIKINGVGTLKVDAVTISRGDGGSATMTVTYVPNPAAGTAEPDPKNPNDFTVEVESAEVQKRLETSPLYSGGGAKELTTADLIAIESWRNAADQNVRNGLYTNLQPNAKHFVDKLLKGVDSWLDYIPIVTVTTRHETRPKTFGAGKIESAPPDAPAGLKWLKTGDRLTRSGRSWTRTQVFTGAKEIDTDLYKA